MTGLGLADDNSESDATMRRKANDYSERKEPARCRRYENHV
jgi:hypothetical protein